MALLSNVTIYPKQLMSVSSVAALPALRGQLNYIKKTRWLSRSRDLCLHVMKGKSNDKTNHTVVNYDGLWEDPDDGSDDSDYDDESEDDEKEENDLDYESDWENEKRTKAVASNSERLSTEKYEHDLVKEVELMLGPEERAILEQNEDCNLDNVSTAKWMPLHTFALAGQIKFMDGLLENGYNIDLVDKDGFTALHRAVIGKREAVISHLLRKGANPEPRDQDGATPLHYAAQVGAIQTVKLLIKYRVDVNVVDSEGWTPLHVALQARNRDIAKVLLVNGADKNCRNKDGKTPLDLSLCYGKEFKSYELAKLLKQISPTRSLMDQIVH